MILPDLLSKCAVIAAFGALLPAVPAAAQSCSPTNIISVAILNKDNDGIHGAARFGQTFVSTVSNCLAQVTLFACKSGGYKSENVPVQGLVVELRGVSGTAPDLTGAALATATVAAGDISTFCAKGNDPLQFGAVNAVFSSQPPLTAGQSYSLVFYQANGGGSGNQYYKLGLEKPGTYTAGQFCSYDGSAWDCPQSAGAIDTPLSICTAACCSGCTYTQGYWKNHSEWPVSMLKLGTVDYSQAELIAILETPVAGNGLVQLAHQLIAAKLNQAKGACVPQPVLNAIAAADALIGAKVIPEESVPTAQTSALTEILDTYNVSVRPTAPLDSRRMIYRLCANQAAGVSVLIF